MKNKMTKLIGVDFRSLGPDVCIPQIIQCALVAEIVEVQIENALVCMRYRSWKGKISMLGLNYNPVLSYDDVSSLQKPSGIPEMCMCVCACLYVHVYLYVKLAKSRKK